MTGASTRRSRSFCERRQAVHAGQPDVEHDDVVAAARSRDRGRPRRTRPPRRRSPRRAARRSARCARRLRRRRSGSMVSCSARSPGRCLHVSRATRSRTASPRVLSPTSIDAAVLGDDAADDRQAEAAAPPLGRVVRHEQLVAVGRRHAGPVVGDDDAHDARWRASCWSSRDRWRVAGRARLRRQRLDRVVDQVDDRPAGSARRRAAPAAAPAAKRRSICDVAEEPVVERQRLVEQPFRLGRHRARRRHARELRELVDQPLERFDLGDDRRRALVDERARRFGGAPPKWRRMRSARQLDRRQRVLDLVREPPRHVAPRRDALRRGSAASRRRTPAPCLRARRSSPCSAVAAAARCISRPSRASAISCAAGLPDAAVDATAARAPQRLQVLAAEHFVGRAARRSPGSTSSSRASRAVDRARPARPAPIETTPVAIRSSTVSM